MSNRDALYHAILANPGDDTPRLVYADWLEENGSPEEAEFIRADCRLEAITPDDAEYTDLLDRREELRLWLIAHAPGPQLTLPHLLSFEGGSSWWVRTYRGFPRFLEYSGYQRTGLKPMRELAAALQQAFQILPTRWLVVRFLTPKQLAELLKQPEVAGLERLGVQMYTSNQQLDGVAQVIANCPHLRNLRGLYLWFEIDEAGAQALARSEHLGQLRTLAVQADYLTPAAISALVGANWFGGLRELRFEDNLSTEAFEELCRSQPLPALHTLSLTNTQFPVSAWHTFAASKAFPALSNLDLSRTDMSGGRFAAFAEARWLRLAEINLSACAIGNDGVEALVTAPWIATLSRLELHHSRLTPVGAARITSCRQFGQLQHLDLGYNQLGVSSFRNIAHNPALRGLTALRLLNNSYENTHVTPAQIGRFLADLNMPKLRHLDLSGWALSPDAVKPLTDEKYTSLTRLELARCQLTKTATRVLLKAPTLQNLIELNLADNPVKSALKLLTDRRTLPQLSRCTITARHLPADLIRKLKRRPGVIL